MADVPVAACPHCGAGYTFDAVMSLRGQLYRKMQLTGPEEQHAIWIQTPCCGVPITRDDVQSMIGRASVSKRTHHVAGPGRPRDALRCPCGKYTLARALARRHKCKTPEK